MEKIIKTPHINAYAKDFGKNVLVAGDPLRCQHIAETFLKNSKQINSVRGMTAYTGLYKGKKVSVMPHGMGMPSMAIYATELFSFFGVENIIRVGTCGAINKDLNLKDIVVGEKALTDSNILENLNIANAPCSSKLLDIAKQNTKIKPAIIYSSDMFYEPENKINKVKQKCDVIEMETAVLYALANKFNKQALTICSVTDFANGKTGELTASERCLGVDEMIKSALEIIIKA